MVLVILFNRRRHKTMLEKFVLTTSSNINLSCSGINLSVLTLSEDRFRCQKRNLAWFWKVWWQCYRSIALLHVFFPVITPEVFAWNVKGNFSNIVLWRLRLNKVEYSWSVSQLICFFFLEKIAWVNFINLSRYKVSPLERYGNLVLSGAKSKITALNSI